ncbi:CLAVATA3/ESR (CLE)-related protein 25-like [Sesamum indicum]|uniref:CLAVATA3/ESR (CLE)-related protein 25-like n=1 Tax=Sesamum indicum TaxID=4182 RepID=A0A6I9SQ08_SESIN|nr:CLAVATA3/ESR (CLE)-related protein 25-like [Sesamum indicum]
MSSSSKMLKVLLRLLVLVGVFRFLIVAAATEGGGGRRVKDDDVIRGRENEMKAVSKFDLNYSTKRKVPNGPDPIHNRRAGSSRQPPGQAQNGTTATTNRSKISGEN